MRRDPVSLKDGKTMASDNKKVETGGAPKSEAATKTKSTSAESSPKAEAGGAAKSEAAAKNKSAAAESTPKAEAAGTSAAPSSYSRGEGQKPVTRAYKENWNAIFAKNSVKKKGVKKNAKRKKR